MQAPLLTSSPVIDLGAVLQDLVELCQSPFGLGAPEVGRATLAVSQATTVLSRAATPEDVETDEIQAQVREALSRAREALTAARQAMEQSRRTRGIAEELTVASIRLRQARSGATSVPPVVRAWTSQRRVTVACGACGRQAVLRYEYRFPEGLALRLLPCPFDGCAGELSFYLPVNSVGVSVASAP